jgi:hypothetical protein
MVLIARRHATAVIDWLDAEVSPNQPYRVPDIERTEDSRKNPYYVSPTAQIAEWRGADDLWRVRQSARNRMIEVTCADTQLECYIALRWSQ